MAIKRWCVVCMFAVYCYCYMNFFTSTSVHASLHCPAWIFVMRPHSMQCRVYIGCLSISERTICLPVSLITSTHICRQRQNTVMNAAAAVLQPMHWWQPAPKVQLCVAFCWETRYKTQHRLVVYAFTLVIQSEMKKWLIEGSHGLAHGRTSVSLQRMWQGVFAAAWPEAASSRGPFRRGDLPVHALQQTFRNANKTKQTRAKSYRRKTVSVWGMWSEVSAVECADLPQANAHRTTVVCLWRLSSQICTTS